MALSRADSGRNGKSVATRCCATLVLFTLLIQPGDLAAANEAFPYELETSREIVLTVTGSLALGSGLVIQSKLEPFTPEKIAALDPAGIHSFDRSATRQWSPTAHHASNYLLIPLLISPTLLLTGEQGAKQPLTLGAMYGETLLLTNGLVQLLKAIVRRPRPYLYNDDPRISPAQKSKAEARLSFPSGHAANAFAAAVFLGQTYQDLYPRSDAQGWVWTGGLATATSISYLRYRAGKHYPSDILVGAVLGAAVGYLIPILHQTDTQTPADGAKRGGLHLAWGFGF